VEEDGEGSIEKDGEGCWSLLQQKAVGETFGGSSAEGENGIGAAESGGQSGGFEAAEVGLAGALGELGNSGGSALLKVGGKIEGGPAKTGGEGTADCRLSGSHESCENEAAKVLR